MTKYELKSGSSIGSETRAQLSYNNEGKASKNISCLAMPSKVIADASLAAQYVGKGNLCRIHGSAGALVKFGDDTAAAPILADNDALLLDASIIMVVATDEFIRTSAAIRVEIIED